MLLKIKLYGGLTCSNQSLQSFGMNRFEMEVPKGITLQGGHKLLGLSFKHSLVSIVDGHAELPDYSIEKDCIISIFCPMSDKQHNFFERI